MNAMNFSIRYFLRHYARALYLASLLLARRRWQRAAIKALRAGFFAQAGFASERANAVGAEIRHMVRNEELRTEAKIRWRN